MSLVAGVDSSTQSTKVVIVDTETGELVSSGTAPHVVSGSGGARESDPACWEEALISALGAALSSAGGSRARSSDVAAISVGAQQHGLVVLDDGGRPLRPGILWNDTRSAREAAALVSALGGPDECAKRVGSVLTPAFTVAKWAWLRKAEPEVARAAHAVCLPHDYLTGLLTAASPGALATDRSDVSGSGWWGPSEQRYAEDVLALPEVGMDAGMLPTVLGPEERGGEVPASVAARFGLAPGVVVGPGAGDNAAAGLALGLERGEAALSLGTSGTVFVVADQPSADPEGVVAGFASADGGYLPLVCTLNATVAVDRVAAWLGLGRDDVAPSGEVVFLPWLDGERTPNLPGASGTLTGLRHDTDARLCSKPPTKGPPPRSSPAWTASRHGRRSPKVHPSCSSAGGRRARFGERQSGGSRGTGWSSPRPASSWRWELRSKPRLSWKGSDRAKIARRWGTRRGSEEGALPKDLEKVARIQAWASFVGSWAAGLGRS